MDAETHLVAETEEADAPSRVKLSTADIPAGHCGDAAAAAAAAAVVAASVVATASRVGTAANRLVGAVIIVRVLWGKRGERERERIGVK
jgi:hypothetical protein